ncbi:unnamed protein product [Allacma fusca]|uniref:Uncharacterized protein n=1 Tax=Allacma fusca TaxID=39272 RepID=A0A8J2KZR6_9HEXA|nr:unnamed protein product [Allacma fusca]
MPCSAVTLSLATIAAVVSVALLAIAFSTDNWIRVDVARSQDLENSVDPEQWKSEYIYFTRTKGLFRICFPNPQYRPQGVPLYLSPVETYCMNIDYFIPEVERNDQVNLDPDRMAALHMGRAMIGLFIFAFLFVFIAFWTGVAGCWRRSSANITTTAILLLLTCLFSAGGMGLWHGVEYYETEKLSGQEYYKQWTTELKKDSRISYDWSFYLSWLSVGFSLLSSALFASAGTCITSEKKDINSSNSANGQYVMTVYPQKQQGYAYGYAYPTPAYAYQGNQYPPYNY